MRPTAEKAIQLDPLSAESYDALGAAYARGTGIQPDGGTGGVASGLGPNTQNWALGATVTFPAFDWFSIRAKKEIEVHNERSAAANYDFSPIGGDHGAYDGVDDAALQDVPWRATHKYFAIQGYGPRAGPQQPADRFQDGRLTGTVRPDHARDGTH